MHLRGYFASLGYPTIFGKIKNLSVMQFLMSNLRELFLNMHVIIEDWVLARALGMQANQTVELGAEISEGEGHQNNHQL